MDTNDCFIIRPVTVDSTILTSSNVAEPATGADPDPAVWVGATNYATGAQATVVAQHSIYQRLSPGGVDASSPETAPTKWVRVGSTNAWKMFDAATNTQTTATGDIIVVITPTTWADSIAFDNVDADSIRVQVAGSTYDQTISMKQRECLNYYQYFFEPFRQRTAAVFTGLPLLVGSAITVTLHKGTGTAKCGAAILGLSKVIGKTQYGASLGIVDYTVKSTDAFGVTSIVERPYSKRQSIEVLIDNSRLDEVFTLLSTYRAKPVVYATAGNLYSSMILVGFYKSFDIVVEYYANSRVNLDIEGLT